MRKKNCKNYYNEKKEAEKERKRLLCLHAFSVRILCISKSHTIDKLQIIQLTCVLHRIIRTICRRDRIISVCVQKKRYEMKSKEEKKKTQTICIVAIPAHYN